MLIFLNQIIKFILDNSERGIIFCMTKEEAKNVYELLIDEGASCGLYHSSIDETQKQKVYMDWYRGINQIIIATSAFSLGDFTI